MINIQKILSQGEGLTVEFKRAKNELPSSLFDESFPKNPNIANIFTQMGRSEELGTGVKNVFKYSKAYSGSDKIVFEENDVFIAKVPLKESFQDTDNSTERPDERKDEGLNEGLNEGLTTLLNTIIKNPGIQARNLSTLLNNRPIKTIERQISELTQRKFIERRGSKKTGGYFSNSELRTPNFE